MTSKNNVIAFFDVDDTLIVGTNSLYLYVKYQVQQGLMSRWELMKGLILSALHRLNLINVERMLDDFAKPYKGMSDKKMNEVSQVWFETLVKRFLSVEGKQKILEHKKQGHQVVLLSTATQYVCKPIMDFLELDHMLHTEALVDEHGFLTGLLRKPLCHKEGKVFWAEQYAQSQEAQLKDCYFYTDSFSDRPMLEAVGFPVVINPDPKLKQLAHSKKWPCYFWQKKLGSS